MGEKLGVVYNSCVQTLVLHFRDAVDLLTITGSQHFSEVMGNLFQLTVSILVRPYQHLGFKNRVCTLEDLEHSGKEASFSEQCCLF